MGCRHSHRVRPPRRQRAVVSHPIVTLQFEPADQSLEFEPFERHWYHAPRIGDHVEIVIPGRGVVHGQVAQVIWTEDHTVVRLI